MDFVEAKGARMPAIGLGTFQVRGRECYDAVTHALAVGYRHVDTAQMYGNEEEVGRGIADADVSRDEVWVTTKVWKDNAAPDQVRASHEESLRKLRTDYVDLLLIHWPTHGTPVADTLEAMGALVEEGKARHIGVSNYPVSWVREATRAADILTNQVEYHPYLSQEPVLNEAEADGHIVTAYSPVAQGQIVDDDTLRDIAAGHGKTPAQVALRWLLQQPRVAAIPRSTNPQRRQENFDVFDFDLSDDEMKAITSLTGRSVRTINPPFAPAWDT